MQHSTIVVPLRIEPTRKDLNLRSIILFLLLMQGVLAHAQDSTLIRVTKNQGDCIGAYVINDTIFGPVLSPKGFGNKIDIQGYELGNPHFFEREHNTVWYKIKVPYKTRFSFDIVPVNPDDDFDFLLFQNPGPSFCNQVKNGDVVPVRTNISRIAAEVKGRTGLSHESVDEYVPSGPGSPYSKSVQAAKGDVFILVIDNPFRENRGHSIHIHYDRPPARAKRRKPKPKAKVEPQAFTVKVVDKTSGEPLTADISIAGVGTDPMVQNNLSEFLYTGELYRTYTVRVDKTGYMFASKKVTAFRKDNLEVVIELRKIEPGAKVALNNIRFEGDKATILPGSAESLTQLLEFLQKNNAVVVEIQGHVNAPNEKNKGKYKSLSKDRANAVFEYLVSKGIERTRMTYKGFGNAEMIYPNPRTEQQSQANRRVEIKVVSQ